jgi:ESCRT-II complex subunit VPS22
VLRAIEKLKSLGGGFGMVKIGATQFVRSVPKEMNTDTNAVIELAQVRARGQPNIYG